MNAAELREALDKGLRYPTDMALIEDAARTIALPILEADPELVERWGAIIRKHSESWFGGVEYDWYGLADEADDIAAELLAAISTPTPVGPQ